MHTNGMNQPDTFNIDDYLQQLPQRPGVYQMLGTDDEVLYVGKAVNLKNRVSSYFRGKSHNAKTHLMVGRIVRIEITITHSEVEALLLENTLIKRIKPRFNIALRDDKSYPFIYISVADQYPALQYMRGKQCRKGQYFGPYPNANAVRESLNLLQKIFLLRQCDNSFFQNRSRPCLQYQIKRCSAPCTGLITPQQYRNDLHHAQLFLQGKSQQLLHELREAMHQAAEQLDFETAARKRDQLSHLRQVQEQQHVISSRGDLDILAIAMLGAVHCTHHLMVRGGRVVGNKNYFPKIRLENKPSTVMNAFLGQFYLVGKQHAIPDEIIVNVMDTDTTAIAKAIQFQGHKNLRITSNVRGQRANWLKLAMTNAEQALVVHQASRESYMTRLRSLQILLDMDQLPERLECFDISHNRGEATVASCVVFDQSGPRKVDYRLFNIKGITPGDDYAAMEQAIKRRYTKVKQGQGSLPDLLVIDGGQGQLGRVMRTMAELQLQDLVVLGIAKGDTRKAGFERIFNAWSGAEITLPADSSVLHLIQHIRDESHRFAISGHRQQRARKCTQSKLQQIEGIGPQRRRALLQYFGSVAAVSKASIDELTKVKGFSRSLAQHVYATMRGEL